MLTHCLQLEEGLSAMRRVHSSQGLTRATGTQHKRRVEKRKKLMDSIKMIVTEQHKAGEGLSTARCVEILDSVADCVLANKKRRLGNDGNQVKMRQGGYQDKRDDSLYQASGEEEGSEEEAGPSTSANVVRFLQGKDKQEKSKQEKQGKKKKSNKKQNQPEATAEKSKQEKQGNTTEEMTDDDESDMCEV